AERVQAVCAKYELPYTTGPLARQYLLVLRTIIKLALPDRFLVASSDDAPETASEEKFRGVIRPRRAVEGKPVARRRRLAIAIRNRSNRLNQRPG
ncbi:MAG: acyl-CoA desaturase, partial [Mycobacterium sp.]